MSSDTAESNDPSTYLAGLPDFLWGNRIMVLAVLIPWMFFARTIWMETSSKTTDLQSWAQLGDAMNLLTGGLACVTSLMTAFALLVQVRELASNAAEQKKSVERLSEQLTIAKATAMAQIEAAEAQKSAAIAQSGLERAMNNLAGWQTFVVTDQMFSRALNRIAFHKAELKKLTMQIERAQAQAKSTVREFFNIKAVASLGNSFEERIGGELKRIDELSADAHRILASVYNESQLPYLDQDTFSHAFNFEVPDYSSYLKAIDGVTAILVQTRKSNWYVSAKFEIDSTNWMNAAPLPELIDMENSVRNARSVWHRSQATRSLYSTFLASFDSTGLQPEASGEPAPAETSDDSAPPDPA